MDLPSVAMLHPLSCRCFAILRLAAPALEPTLFRWCKSTNAYQNAKTTPIWGGFCVLVAGVGFEPTTFRLWAWRATGLLHPAASDNWLKLIRFFIGVKCSNNSLLASALSAFHGMRSIPGTKLKMIQKNRLDRRFVWSLILWKGSLSLIDLATTYSSAP